MFNIGGGELIVILLIALIVLGPQRLPDAARQLGKAMGDLRRLSTGFQDEMKQALETADDPTRIAPRRNVLGRDEAAPAADDDPEAVGAAAPQDPAPEAAPRAARADRPGRGLHRRGQRATLCATEADPAGIRGAGGGEEGGLERRLGAHPAVPERVR